MALKFVIVSCAFVACLGQPQQGAMPVPASTPAPVYCSATPAHVLGCLNNPKVLKKEIIGKCRIDLSECDKYKCIFRASDWALPGDKVNKAKVGEYFTTYASENPEWSAAVTHLKAACLDKDLPAQGAVLDCPAFDVAHCVLSSFLRHALPSQWKTSAECAYPRAYAASCPLCPESCFAAQVPYGSCNACAALPTTP